MGWWVKLLCRKKLDFGFRLILWELHSSALTPKHEGWELLSGLAVTLSEKQSSDPPPFVCAVASNGHLRTKLLNASAKTPRQNSCCYCRFWHLCSSPVGSTFLESYHLYRINECPSTYASEHGVQSQSHGRQGETFPWFRWAADQSCGCVEAHLIWLRSSMVLHWGGFLQWLLFPAGAVLL